ncbi:hypothetical protein AB0O34_04045 [Sphaerisporangium sp. NPDC088356]|uniref:hypothetical protein n=1 Tax=Sphaerisporangium sp. NPDC088356 TaxID=3154871 RepID=UPI00342B26DE
MTGPGRHAREPGPPDAELPDTKLPHAKLPHAEPADAEPADPYGFPATAGIGCGRYIPASGRPAPPPLVPEEVTTLVERQVAALNQTYPAWRITRVKRADGTPGGWWATRHATLTDDQRASGLVPSIARGDVVALVMELAVQDEIAHQNGYATGGTRRVTIVESPS